MTDLLIIGGGFAGMCCAQEAWMRNLTYHLADPNTGKNATRIAAGVMNPVSGRRYKLQWHYAELHEAALQTYASMEMRFQTRLMHHYPIFKMHKSEAALEAWMTAKSTEMPACVEDPAPQFSWLKHADNRFGAILVHSAMRVDTQTMTDHFFSPNYPEHITTDIQYDQIQVHNDHVEWEGRSYRHIICCEGVHVTNNPWFRNIPLKPAKGECMIAHIPFLKANCILQKKVFAVPMEDDRYWIGATNDFDTLDHIPTQTGLQELTEGLRDMVKLPFTVESHVAAIRPTMRDRSPVAGTHNRHAPVHILNGLGTKGSMLAPFYAQQLLDHIFHGSALSRETDVNRFNY